MWLAWKVNKALAMLGVDPMSVNGEYRRGAQQIGKIAGLTPEETALCIVGQMPSEFHFNTDNAIALWRREGKISFEKQDVRNAMHSLGYAGFLI